MTAPLKQRFEAKVQVTPGCWPWIGSLGGGTGDGRYGSIKHLGKVMAAHRVSYQLHVGEIPHGLHVLHRCDNPRCVNPDHLRLGTHLDNMRDMYSKGRRKAATGLRCGSAKLSDEQKLFIVQTQRPAGDVAPELGVTARRVNQIRRAAASMQSGANHG
jgi:hypothetical protein